MCIYPDFKQPPWLGDWEMGDWQQHASNRHQDDAHKHFETPDCSIAGEPAQGVRALTCSLCSAVASIYSSERSQKLWLQIRNQTFFLPWSPPDTSRAGARKEPRAH